MEKFKELGIIEPILKSIHENKFENPTEIQEKSIPLILKGKDVIAESATGSGKTLAFASGIIQNAKKNDGIQALILTPTRELAEQVSKEFKKFAKYQPLEITAVYGGVAIDPQIRKLRTTNVVVGTPGRILDHIERRTINLGKVSTLVLDEADVMLDMGFIDDVERIIKKCPRERQTLFYSATMHSEIKHLAEKHMNNPQRVSVNSYVDPKKLKQVYYNIKDNLKLSLLVHLLKNEKTGLVMVFCNSRKTTDFVTSNLKTNLIQATAIHGGFSQAKRSKVLTQFNSKDTHVLVCTDVAARGLDIKGVSHIYNYDSPRESKQYVHRIGRTARAGKEGKAINLLSDRDYENFSRVLRDNDVEVSQEETPQLERIRIQKTMRSRGHKNFVRKHYGR